MVTRSRTKFLVTVIISLLIISSVYTFVIPRVYAAEVTTEQKGLSALTNVVGLDLTKYDVKTQGSNQSLPFLDGTLQENILFNLTSENSKLSIFYTYTNGNLQGLYVLENEGTPVLTKSTVSINAVESAKDFLTNYQAYSNKQVFGELQSTLTNVDASKNITKTIDNTVLEQTVYNDSQTYFKWYYTANGAIAPYTKTIAMGFKNGFLTSFIDNWELYPVGSTNVNLSKDQAVALALDIAKNHNWTMQLDQDTLDPINFNKDKSVSWITLSFDNSIDADTTRSKNSLEFYPVWKVGIVLNKVYGELYGLEVDIWADTKEIRSVDEQYSQLAAQWLQNATMSADASTKNNQTLANGIQVSLALIASIAVAMTVTGICTVAIIRKKSLKISHQLKSRSPRVLGLILCFLTLLVVFLPLVESASASNAGIIWGSRSSGASNSPVSYSWRKTDGEINRQSYVTSYIASNFFTAANGYTGYSNHGVNKDVILYQAGYLRDNFDYMAVLDWDHGVGGRPPQAPNEDHYMFEDDCGTKIGSPSNFYTDLSHGVYDMEIHNVIPPAKAHFVFIDACQSANLDRLGEGYLPSGNAVGLPFAFTHRIVTYLPTGTQMSADGYSFPDAFPQCYIGFPMGSAALDQHVDYNQDTENYGTGPYWYNWILFFYYFALDYDISVKDALDLASYQTWQCNNFASSPLRGAGFTAVWPMYGYNSTSQRWEWMDTVGSQSTLAVYGNANIHLRNFSPSDMLIGPDLSGPIQGDLYQSYTFSAKAIDSHCHRIKYLFDWGDGTQSWIDDYTINGVVASKSHTWTSGGTYSVKVKAQCENGQWSDWSNTINIAIGTYYWLTVDACDQYGQFFTGVTIDGNYYGTPVSVLVSPGSHSVWAEPYPGYSYLVGFSDGLGNGDYRQIYSDTQITAYYQSFW